ncbi:hypothetical protein [Tsuneonella sp. SYSU-LHT278]|uniref:hypothetical protein n=1 Tax=Tsuneonella sediminis TaxID=3416089 RepID=UPI003F78C877
MTRLGLLPAILLSAACSADAGYVVRYDLDQLAYETSERDASPGFESLPESVPAGVEPPAA